MEQAVAAPYCAARLADAGARAIKIEGAEGDFARGYDAAASGQSSYFVWLNRGKESVVLDTEAAEDKALLERPVAAADMFIQNLAPGAAARAGFGSEALRARGDRGGTGAALQRRGARTRLGASARRAHRARPSGVRAMTRRPTPARSRTRAAEPEP